MRRVSALVVRERFDALHPAGEVGKSLREREEAQLEWLGGFFGRGAQEQLNQWKDDDVCGGNLIAHQPLRAGQALVDHFELVAQRLRGLLDFFDFIQSFGKEKRANDFVAGTYHIGFTFSDRAPNQTGFLGSLAEQRRIGVFAIEVTHDRKRLVQNEISIFESGNLATRVEPEIGRRFVFAFGKLQEFRFICQPFYFQCQHHPPSERTAASPIKFNCHNSLSCGFLRSKLMSFSKSLSRTEQKASSELSLTNKP